MNKENTLKDRIIQAFKLNADDTEQIYNDCKRYIKAIKEGRIICNIDKVSQSGMSRNIKFLECSKSKYYKNTHQYLNFYFLFKVLDYSEVKQTGTFRISGCGMDMIFNTNYCIIHRLKRLGFISAKQCAILAQQTPTVI
tara:strand:+ start:253 stop:669 length:417 start_codon:yes stop_codon:yes gene_type:complete